MLEALKARILAKSEAERALEVIEQGTKDRQARLEADAEVAETQRLEALRAELGELRGRLQQLITRQAALLASVQERITALCPLVRELSQINTEGQASSNRFGACSRSYTRHHWGMAGVPAIG